MWNLVRKCKFRQYFGQKYIKKKLIFKKKGKEKKRKEMKFVVSWGGTLIPYSAGRGELPSSSQGFFLLSHIRIVLPLDP
jgi:hypothetical protein